MPNSCGAGDPTQSFTHAWQALYQLGCIPVQLPLLPTSWALCIDGPGNEHENLAHTDASLHLTAKRLEPWRSTWGFFGPRDWLVGAVLESEPGQKALQTYTGSQAAQQPLLQEADPAGSPEVPFPETQIQECFQIVNDTKSMERLSDPASLARPPLGHL